MKINCNKWKKHTNKSTNMQDNYKVTDILKNAQKHKHDTRQDEGWLCRGEISHTD